MLTFLMLFVVGSASATDDVVPVCPAPVMTEAQRFQRVLSPLASRSQAVQSEPAPERYVPGVVVVRFGAHLDDDAIRAFCERERVEVLKKGRFINYHLLGLPADFTVEDAVRRLSAFSEVEFAEPNYIYRALWSPDDPFYWPLQWNLRRDGALDMQLAWELTTGSDSVIVAVVDQGVAYEDYDIPSHEIGEVYSPDGRYHRAPDLANAQFVQGYDCVNEDWHANDEGGHGTHVAGTIAQSTNNGLGVAGMAFGCRIMPVRVLNEYGSGTEADIADGISFAWQNGANVINLSLGSSDSSHLIHLAVIDAVNAGAVVVAAAGNNGENRVSYPAAHQECIAVGAVDYWWQKTPYSNWGTALDVVAPGGDTRSQNYWPIWQNTYAEAGQTPPINVSTFDYLGWEGTSMATPHVSALVAMMMSRGIRNPTEIKVRLYRSAIDLGDPGWDSLHGHGLIEPVTALGGQASLLSYDNYYPDAYWYISNGSERRVAVCFTPDLNSPFAITEGHVLVKDDGGRYNFRLSLNPLGTGGYPDLSTNLAGPVTFTTVGDAHYAYWYYWDFAGVPRSSSAPFFLVFHWVPPNFGPPFVGGDSTNISNRSYYYSLAGWQRTNAVDWYLRTILLKDTLTIGIAETYHPVAPVSPEGIVAVVPQPTRKSVSILYSLPAPGAVRLQILDCTGRVVRNLAAQDVSAGRNALTWDCTDTYGRRLGNGVYFVQLVVGSELYRARVQLVD